MMYSSTTCQMAQINTFMERLKIPEMNCLYYSYLLEDVES